MDGREAATGAEAATAQTALITGAARGIGAATARAFAAAGLRVAVHHRTHRSEAEALLASLPGDGHTLLAADLVEPDAATDLMDRAVRDLGSVDVLVSNAGQWIGHPPTTTDYREWQDAWRRTLDVNLTGAANLAWAMTDHLVHRTSGPAAGRMIFVGSRGAYRGEPEAPAYGAAKAGVHALAQSLAAHLGPYDVGVYAVAPGVIRTELTSYLLKGPIGEEIRSQSPFGRVGDAAEVADAILWLSSRPALWASGTVLDLNGASYLR